MLTGIMETTAAPQEKFAYHEENLKELISSLDRAIKKTGDTLKIVQKYLDSLAGVAFDNHQALDYLLASQRGIYTVINKTCCTYNVIG